MAPDFQGVPLTVPGVSSGGRGWLVVGWVECLVGGFWTVLSGLVRVAGFRWRFELFRRSRLPICRW